MGEVAHLNRTLGQELSALLRGASLECPLCGEFVLHDETAIRCNECGSEIEKETRSKVELSLQAG